MFEQILLGDGQGLGADEDRSGATEVDAEPVHRQDGVHALGGQRQLRFVSSVLPKVNEPENHPLQLVGLQSFQHTEHPPFSGRPQR